MSCWNLVGSSGLIEKSVGWKLFDRGVTEGYMELHPEVESGSRAIDVSSYMIYNKEQEDTSRYKTGVFS